MRCAGVISGTTRPTTAHVNLLWTSRVGRSIRWELLPYRRTMFSPERGQTWKLGIDSCRRVEAVRSFQFVVDRCSVKGYSPGLPGGVTNCHRTEGKTPLSALVGQ
jgi:hypothetical protein